MPGPTSPPSVATTGPNSTVGPPGVSSHCTRDGIRRGAGLALGTSCCEAQSDGNNNHQPHFQPPVFSNLLVTGARCFFTGRLASPFDSIDDSTGRLGPSEGFVSVRVVGLNESADLISQFAHADEDAAPEGAPLQLTEPGLDGLRKCGGNVGRPPHLAVSLQHRTPPSQVSKSGTEAHRNHQSVRKPREPRIHNGRISSSAAGYRERYARLAPDRPLVME